MVLNGLYEEQRLGCDSIFICPLLFKAKEGSQEQQDAEIKLPGFTTLQCIEVSIEV